jgi:hypothetical protein
MWYIVFVNHEHSGPAGVIEARRVPFASDYELTSDGRVFSLKGGSRREIHPWLEKNGYRRVTLRVDGRGRKFWLQNLMCLTFKGPPPSPKHEARHINGDPSSNDVANLEWGTHTENMQDMVRHGRSQTSPRPNICGANHPMRRHPEKVPRGEKNGNARLSA